MTPINPLVFFGWFPGVLGEGALTIGLLVKGVDVGKWRERALASKAPPAPASARP